jgi:hypothetical protein
MSADEGDEGLVSPDLARSLRAGAEDVAQYATRVSNQLNALERWLNSLPGKLVATAWDNVPHEAPWFVLSFRRRGSQWIFVYDEVVKRAPQGEPQKYDWKPLAGSSLEVKLQACELLPELLKGIDRGQRVRARELKIAADSLADLSAQLGLKQEGKSNG